MRSELDIDHSAAVYALDQWLNCSPIYVVNRDDAEVAQFIGDFAKNATDKFNPKLVHVKTVEEAEKLEAPGASLLTAQVQDTRWGARLTRSSGQHTSSRPSRRSRPKLSRRSRRVPCRRSSCASQNAVKLIRAQADFRFARQQQAGEGRHPGDVCCPPLPLAQNRNDLLISGLSLNRCYHPDIWTELAQIAKDAGWNVVTGEQAMMCVHPTVFDCIWQAGHCLRRVYQSSLSWR